MLQGERHCCLLKKQERFSLNSCYGDGAGRPRRHRGPSRLLDELPGARQHSPLLTVSEALRWHPPKDMAGPQVPLGVGPRSWGTLCPQPGWGRARHLGQDTSQGNGQEGASCCGRDSHKQVRAKAAFGSLSLAGQHGARNPEEAHFTQTQGWGCWRVGSTQRNTRLEATADS